MQRPILVVVVFRGGRGGASWGRRTTNPAMSSPSFVLVQLLALPLLLLSTPLPMAREDDGLPNRLHACMHVYSDSTCKQDTYIHT